MNRSLIIVSLGLLSFLCACSKDPNEPPRTAPIPLQSEISIPSKPSDTIVFMGQSNAQALWAHASDLFHAAYQNATTTNCALGNTSIDQWKPGSTLYNQCLDKLQSENLHPILIIFWQGEYEAQHGPSDSWAHNFTITMNAFRSDLKQNNLPVRYARLSNQITGDYWNEIRYQQESVILSDGKMIDLDGIQRADNDLHYTEETYRECAQRFL